MLSNETFTFLNQYCDESDKMFQDGGTNYIFKFGRKFIFIIIITIKYQYYKNIGVYLLTFWK